MNEQDIEQAIKDKGLVAPRITNEQVVASIANVQYHRFPGTTVTVCCITLKNGFNVMGHSACVSKENFDADIGMGIAFDNAKEEIWKYLGYSLADSIARTVKQ